MEQLLSIFEQRIQELTELFLKLLNNLQNSKIFVPNTSLAQYRIEYVGMIIKETLKNKQQKQILSMSLEIAQLRKQLKRKSSELSLHREFSSIHQYNSEQSGIQSLQNLEYEEATLDNSINFTPKAKNLEFREQQSKLIKSNTGKYNNKNPKFMSKTASKIENTEELKFKYLKLKI